MNKPVYTASATASSKGSRGIFFRSANASSTISQADAREKAFALARSHAADAASGKVRESQERYPYGVRTLVEPVLERVNVASAGRNSGNAPGEIARVTRNSYEASVLNAYSVMFVDVDTGAQPGIDPQTNELVVSQDEAIGALVDLVAARPELSFRVYATRAGLRYLCTSRLFDPASEESEEILNRLKSDKRYVLLCRKQKCYRARLSPKRWRCFAKIPVAVPDASLQQQPEPRGFFAKLFSSAGSSKPRMRTITEPSEFAVCHYVQTVGTEKITLPEVERIVRLHDDACGATTGKPLA